MKLNSVQYLRGLAALLVVIAHAADHPLAEPSLLLGNIGELGVTLFFVISGFIMVAISGPGAFAVGPFLKRRAIRVIPMYWTFTTVAAVLALFLPAIFKTTVFTWPHYLQSMAFIPHEAPGRGGYSPILALGWTLNYEVFFYAAFAACAALAAMRRVVVLSIVLGGLSVFGLLMRPENLVLSFYANASLLAFCAGAWIGLLVTNGQISKISARLAVLAAVAGLVALTIGLAADGVVTFVGLLLASALFLLSGVRLEQSLPRLPFLERMGDASYSMYLVHMFVVGAVVAVGGKLLPFGGTAEYAVVVAGAIVLAIAAGLAVHSGFEKPLLKLCNRVFLGEVNSRRPGPVAAAE